MSFTLVLLKLFRRLALPPDRLELAGDFEGLDEEFAASSAWVQQEKVSIEAEDSKPYVARWC